MKILYPLLLVCILISIRTNSTAQDYSNDQLFSVYGNEHYKKGNDCKPNVVIESINNILRFTITVKDDSVNISDDWKNSDHVEIWLNMDRDSNDYFVYQKEFYGGGKINDSTRKNFRNYLLDNALGNTDEINTINSSELPIVKEINGMMHWTINLKDSTAFLYDMEYYLKLPITDEVKSKIKISPILTESGYKVIIDFKPEALLFLRNTSNKNITFMVDIFDVDGISNNLNVLSTVGNRKWGAPERFNHINIKEPLRINAGKVPKNIPKNSYTFYHYKNGTWVLYKRDIIKKSPTDLYYKYEYRKIQK